MNGNHHSHARRSTLVLLAGLCAAVGLLAGCLGDPEIDERWNNYEDGGAEDEGGSTTRTGHFRPRIPNSNERFVPFQRPIPDPDDDYNWDFDDKFHLRDRPQRSARRSDARWEAIPVSAMFTPEPSRRVRSQPDRSRAPADDLLPPARSRRPGNEGGWRSLAR